MSHRYSNAPTNADSATPGTVKGGRKCEQVAEGKYRGKEVTLWRTVGLNYSAYVWVENTATGKGRWYYDPSYEAEKAVRGSDAKYEHTDSDDCGCDDCRHESGG